MKIAINLSVIVKNPNFINTIIDLMKKGNRVYIFVDYTEKYGNDTKNVKIIRKEVKSWLEKKQIPFTDIICVDAINKTKILNIMNVGYTIDDDKRVFENLSENNFVAFVGSNDELNSIKHPSISLITAEEILAHFNSYYHYFMKNISDPIMPLSNLPSIDKIWRRKENADQRNVNIPDMSVWEYLYLNNFSNMDALALRYFGKKITFEELFKQVDDYAKVLKLNGIKSGDIVTILMPNTPEAVIAFLATNKIGAIANLLHPLLKAEDIESTLQKTQSSYMIMADMCYKEVKKVLPNTNIKKVVVVSPSDSMPIIGGLPAGIKFLYIAKEKFKNAMIKARKFKLQVAKLFTPNKYSCIIKKIEGQISSLEEELEEIPFNETFVKWKDEIKKSKLYNGKIEPVYIPEAPAVLLKTGGTTGKAKLAVLTNENITANTSQLRDTIPSYEKGNELLAISPIFHGFGLVDSIVTALAVNMSVDLHPQYNKPIFIKAVLKNKPTLILGVPTLFKSLISNKRFNRKSLPFAKVWISGGDTLAIELQERINAWRKEHNAPNPLFSGIGLTEATAAIGFTGLNSSNPYSVGFPLPLNEVKIVKQGTEEELGYNEIGELCIIGPTTMKEYYHDEEETSIVYKKHQDGKTWLHTGDLCYLDEQGEICFVGREKNVIIVSGVNVYSSEIEPTILEIPEIEDCAVVGIPHQYKMNVPMAFVVLRKGRTLDNNLKEKIIQYCSSKLDAYHRIYDVIQIDTLPLTNLNKVQYNKLREIALEKYGIEEKSSSMPKQKVLQQ